MSPCQFTGGEAEDWPHHLGVCFEYLDICNDNGWAPDS